MKWRYFMPTRDMWLGIAVTQAVCALWMPSRGGLVVAAILSFFGWVASSKEGGSHE